MDGRRSYPNDPEPWFPEDDPRRVPGPRDPRYAEFGEAQARHGAEQPGWGFEPRDPDDRDVDPRDFDRGDYGRVDLPPREEFARGPEDDPLSGGFDAGGPARRRQTRPRGRRSGLELPPVGGMDPHEDEMEQAPRFHTETLDRNALRRPDQPGPGDRGPLDHGPGDRGLADRGTGERDEVRPAGAPQPTSTVYAAPTQSLPNAAPARVYRARRPGIAALLGVSAAFIDVIIALKVFLASLLHGGLVHQGGVMGGLFALAGVPLVAIGLYGLATGAATAGGPNVGRAWLRTPLAYLPIGLVILVAAGLAVS